MPLPFFLAHHTLPLPPYLFSCSPITRSRNPAFCRPTRCSSPSRFRSDVEDDVVPIGDCIVFDDDAFEPLHEDREADRRASSRIPSGEGELVPEKWRVVVEEINLSKKEKRRISHQIRFGSKMVGASKRPFPVHASEEYRSFREMKLSQLNPVALDVPREFNEKVVVVREPETSGRVAPRNPRIGLENAGIQKIEEFFNSKDYVPALVEDDKSPKGRRKLFTDEEKTQLSKRRPDLQMAASSKWMPLHTLAASGDFFLLDKLLKHNVDINGLDKDGLSVIHKAIISKKQAITNYLLRNSANPFVRDKDGATLMHYAVQTASIPAIKILLLYNVDVNLPDEDGWTPLHLAVQTQRTDITKLLLIKGADRSLKNRDGFTPLELCLRCGHHARTYELIKLLKEFPLSKPGP